MKRLLLLSIGWMVAALPMHGGLRYRFESRSQPGSLLSGVASIEGRSMRIDVEHGDRFLLKDHTVLLSNDGGATLLMLDPAKKTYSQLDPSALIGELRAVLTSGDGKLSVSNPKVVVTPIGDGGKVSGFKTLQYRVSTSYDLTIIVLGGGVKSTIRSSSTIWATEEIPSSAQMFLQQTRTGITELDRLLEQQSSAVKGFVLRENSSTSISTNGRPAASTTSRIEISKVEKVVLPASLFVLPTGYKKVEMKLGVP